MRSYPSTRTDAMNEPTPATPHRVPPRRLLAAFAVIVVLLMIVGAVSFVRYARRHAPDPQLAAVAPFDIFAPGLDDWRVGLAEDLTQQLGLTAPYRAVPQAVVRERWRGASRPEIAAIELARRTSAGLAIYGRADPLAAAPDSVRVQVVGIDPTSARVRFGIVRTWPRADRAALARALAEDVRARWPHAPVDRTLSR